MEYKSSKPRIALSHGDIGGVSYEIMLKVFADERILELFTPIVYGSRDVLEFWRKRYQLETKAWHLIKHPDEAVDSAVNLIDIADTLVSVEVGKPTPEAGRLALRAFEQASQAVAQGQADVLVTLPINKSAMPPGDFPYTGHTPYLEHHFALKEGESLMLLTSGEVRVALATEHIPISAVSATLTQELIMCKARILEAGLRKDFGIIKPRIALLALNPHSGDNGLIGQEEDLLISPAIRQLQQEGLVVFGPYAADGLWGSGRIDSFDGILAMYHDQGLAPFKAKHMEDGVNVTLGLSIVRTSPDHGTGYDIAGQGIASEHSLRSAIYQGIDILRARRAYAEATSNPLPKFFNPRGREDERSERLPE